MMLLPPKKDTCPVCATKHEPDQPHNGDSMYYLYRFYGIHGRWPTWADAIAHCDAITQGLWKNELYNRKRWTEPTEGEPIAEDPTGLTAQPVGNPNSGGFGPEVAQ